MMRLKIYLFVSVLTSCVFNDLSAQTVEFMESINKKIAQKDYTAAIADCDKGILLNGSNKNFTYAYRGQAKLGLKDYKGAIEDYTSAMMISPNNKSFAFSRANAKRISGDYDGAIQDYDVVLKLDNKHAEAFNYRGRAKYIKGDYDSAVADYSRAIKFYPNFLDAYSNRGYSFYMLRNYSNAYSDYYKVLEIDSTNKEVKEKLRILENTPSIYLPKYIQPKLKVWQQKGDLEKSADYLARVTEQSREKKIKELTDEGIEVLKKIYLKTNNFKDFQIVGYDTDMETYKLRHIDLGEIVIKVPLLQATAFKTNFKTYLFQKQDFLVSDDRMVLSYLEIISPDKIKKFIFDITKQPGYNPQKFLLDFDLVQIDYLGNSTSGQKTKAENKSVIKIGKSDVDENIPYTSKKKENAIGIVIGIENYKNVSPVSYATRDAQYAREYFIKTIGISAEKIYFRTNEDATVGEFKKVFEGWLQNRVDSTSEVYIYYAGHGAPSTDEKAYLIPYDADPNYAQQTGYSLEKLYETLGKLKAANVFIFIDACFSGMNREQKMLLADARSIGIKPKDASSNEKLTIFSAAASNQISSAWPEKSHGLFTYFLLKGLQGDADANKNNSIDVQELENYIKLNVSKQAAFIDREQSPQIKTYHPKFELRK